MPQLGKYAPEVLSAYAVCIAVLVVLVAASWWRARQSAARLERVEKETGRG